MADYLTEKAISKLSFEEAMERLEALLQEAEAGEIGLEASLESYAQGKLLEAHCRGILTRVEQKVTELQADEDGQLSEAQDG